MKAHIFFRLIRVAIGTAQDVDCTPTAEDWQQLYLLAERQALIGIAFAGVQALKRDNPERVKLLPQALRMKWLATAVAIHQRNDLMNRSCAELQCILTARGVRSSIFKGQANLPYYARVSGAENWPCFGSPAILMCGFRAESRWCFSWCSNWLPLARCVKRMPI